MAEEPPHAGSTRSSVAGPPPVGTAAAELQRLYGDVATLVESEMRVLAEDWTFLADVNALHAERFVELGHGADAVVAALADVKQKCDELPGYFALVDELDASLAVLEAAAVKLDQYSRALEKRFLVAP